MFDVERMIANELQLRAVVQSLVDAINAGTLCCDDAARLQTFLDDKIEWLKRIDARLADLRTMH
jgi:hypothetical protein